MNTKIVGLMDYAQYLELGLRHTSRPSLGPYGRATAVLAPQRF